MGCEQVKATTDKAMVSLSLKSPCPEPTPGSAAGAETPEAAVACFKHAVSEGSPSLLLRVTCRSRQAAGCKQNDGSEREAEKAMVELKKQSFDDQMGSWAEPGATGKVQIFAFAKGPKDVVASTVAVCKIAPNDRWAVCDLGEVSKTFAESKIKQR